MKNFNLKKLIKPNKTLLGVGPMSLNCVDATIELANEYLVPLMIIASRRQIDSDDFNGGYVNNWTTSKFAEYVKVRDKSENILLARDHGGPWQNNFEKDEFKDYKDVLNSSLESFKIDILRILNMWKKIFKCDSMLKRIDKLITIIE